MHDAGPTSKHEEARGACCVGNDPSKIADSSEKIDEKSNHCATIELAYQSFAACCCVTHYFLREDHENVVLSHCSRTDL